MPVLVAGPRLVSVACFADLRGKTIAVTRGTTSDQELSRGLKDVPGARIVRHEDATTCTAVATGQQGLLVGAPSVLLAIRQANPARDIVPKFTATAYPYAVGLRKNEPELKAWLDDWVAANLKNGAFNRSINATSACLACGHAALSHPGNTTCPATIPPLETGSRHPPASTRDDVVVALTS